MEQLKDYISGRIIRIVHSDVHGYIVLVSDKWWSCEIHKALCKTHSAEGRDERIMEIDNEIRANTGAKYKVLTDKLDDTYRKYFSSSNPCSDIENNFYIYEWHDKWSGYF